MTYEAVVAHAAQRTRLRRHGAGKAILDCPVCRRKRRLGIREIAGVVWFRCFAGCPQNAVRDALGLSYQDLYPRDLSAHQPLPTGVSAEKLVLNALSAERWTICTHDFADEDEELGVWLVEHLLPARAKAGIRYPWFDFPLTVGFAQKAFRKLGVKLGEHRCAQIINVLEERKRTFLLTWFHTGSWGPDAADDEPEDKPFRIFNLPPAVVFKWFVPLSDQFSRPLSEAFLKTLQRLHPLAPAPEKPLSAAPLMSRAKRRELAHVADLLERLQERERARRAAQVASENDQQTTRRAAA